MALQNNPNMYSGGLANLNPLPYVQIAMQARAKKAAREEAINKYYEDLPNKINDKGIRDAEIPVINEIKEKIYKYGVQNKDALTNSRNPSHGAAKLELDQIFREGKATAQASLNAVGAAKQLTTMLANPKLSWIKDDKGVQEQLMQDIAISELPVNDPNYKPLDVNKYLQEPAPFDATKYFKGFSDVKPDYKVSTKPNPDDKNTLIETQTPVFNEKQKQAIYQRAANDLVGSYAFEKEMKKNLVADPNLIAKLHETFKQNYGRDIADETKDIDMAAAYTLLGLGTAAEKQKVINNQEEDWKKKLAFNKITSAQADRRTAMNKGGGQGGSTATSGNSFDETETEVIVKTGIAGIGQEKVIFKDGEARDGNGNLYSGEVTLTESQVPANAAASMKALGAKRIGDTKTKIVDGVIQEMTPFSGNVYNRTSIENGQKKLNTEQIKAPQMQFGNKKTEKPTTKKAILD